MRGNPTQQFDVSSFVPRDCATNHTSPFGKEKKEDETLRANSRVLGSTVE